MLPLVVNKHGQGRNFNLSAESVKSLPYKNEIYATIDLTESHYSDNSYKVK